MSPKYRAFGWQEGYAAFSGSASALSQVSMPTTPYRDDNPNSRTR